VDDHDVRFLHAACAFAGHAQLDIAVAERLGDFAAVTTRQRDDRHALLVASCNRAQYVRRVAGRRDREQHITGTAQRSDLFGKYFIES